MAFVASRRSLPSPRGMRGACCDECATSSVSSLGDLQSIAQTITATKWLDVLFLVSLSVGAIAGTLSIYDHLKKKKGRRRSPLYYSRERRTAQIPVESMHDVVYGRRAA